MEWDRAMPPEIIMLQGSDSTVPELETAPTGSRHAIAGSFSVMPGLADASLTSLTVDPLEPGAGFVDTLRRPFGDALGDNNGLSGPVLE